MPVIKLTHHTKPNSTMYMLWESPSLAF